MADVGEGPRVEPAVSSWKAQENWRARQFGPTRRVLVASIFLLYLAQTGAGVATYATGSIAIVGYVVIGLFAVI